jgi:hypothetical protein
MHFAARDRLETVHFIFRTALQEFNHGVDIWCDGQATDCQRELDNMAHMRSSGRLVIHDQAPYGLAIVIT